MSGSVHRCFPVNFGKFLRTSFLIEHLNRLCLIFTNVPLHSNAFRYLARGGSRAAATSRMESFVIIVKRLPAVNYYYKVLHLGYCSSPRSTSAGSKNNRKHRNKCEYWLVLGELMSLKN